MDIAREHGGEQTVRFESVGECGPVDVVLFQIENDRVEALMADLRQVPGLSVAMAPHEVITLPKARRTPGGKSSEADRVALSRFTSTD